MKIIPPVPRLFRSIALAVTLASLPLLTSAESITEGRTVHDETGALVGSVVSPLNSSANHAPSVVIERPDGSQLVAPVARLTPNGDRYQLAAPAGANPDVSEADLEKIFEIRSMTMVVIMQSENDTAILADVTNLQYELVGETLRITGETDSTSSLERILEATSMLCDFELAPEFLIRS